MMILRVLAMMLTLSRVLAVAIVAAGDGAQRDLRKKGTTHENVTRSSSSQYEHTVNSTSRQSRPYGNVVFLVTSGQWKFRSGGSDIDSNGVPSGG